MHILYFHQHFSTPQGATGTRSYEMAQALIAEGHSVTMICGQFRVGATGLNQPFERGRREGVIDGIRVIEFDLQYSNNDGFLSRSKTFLRYALSSTGLALRERYDVLFATSTPLTVAIPGIIAKLLRRKPFVFEVRDLWPELPKAMGSITNPILLAMMKALEWASYRSADRCIGLAPGIVEGISDLAGADKPVALIPNGCDLSLFQGDENGTYHHPDLADNDFLAVFAGTHGEANGLNSLLNVAAEIDRRGRNDIKIWLIGSGGRKAELEDEATKRNLSCIRFLDPMPKTALVSVLARANLGIQCLANVPAFYRGTSPNKFFDYLAAGLPVLINYPGWLADFISERDCGVCVPPDEPIAFADALEQAANNRQDWQKKGSNALLVAQSEFDRTKLAACWVKWVTELSPK